MSAFPGTFAFDEYGRPFIILRDQEQQKRITGTDAIKVNENFNIYWEFQGLGNIQWFQ